MVGMGNTAIAAAGSSEAAHAPAAAKSSDAAAALQLLQEFLQVQASRAEVYSRFNQGFRQLLEDGQESAFARLMHEVTPMFNAASQQVIAIESRLKSAPVNRPDLAALLRGVQEQERCKLKLTLSWQALRAAHAAGRFSWQDASDRPRTHGTAAAAAAGGSQQQQRLLALLEELQLQVAQPSAAPEADSAGGCDVSSSGSDQSSKGLSAAAAAAAVKPGFYEAQMQRAAALASAAQQQQQQLVPAAVPSGGCSCHHGQQNHAPPSDPLEPNNPLEPNEVEYKAAVREALQELDGCVGRINGLLEEVREAVAELAEDAAS